jgi:hypothetical protein
VTYGKTVLTALQDVETVLVAYAKEQERRKHLSEEVEHHRKAVELSIKLYVVCRQEASFRSAKARDLSALGSISENAQEALQNVFLAEGLDHVHGFHGFQMFQSRGVLFGAFRHQS